MKKDRNTLYNVLLIILLLLFFSSIPFNYFVKNKYLLLLCQMLGRIIFIFVFIYFSKKYFPKSIFHEKLTRKSLYFLPFLIICFGNVSFSYLTNSYTNDIDFTYLICSGFFYLFVAISEELVFRGIVYRYFTLENNDKLKTIIYSALTFGGVHLLNFFSSFNIGAVSIQVIYTTGLGLILGLIYTYSKNIVLPTVLHFLFNLINDTIYLLIFTPTSNTNYIYFYLINIIIAVVCLIYGIIIWKILERKVNNIVT